jgi:aldehyde:ferredoxin oxidoreductase
MLLPYSFPQMAELTSAVTGHETPVTELLRVGERIVTMFRIFNIREGFTDADDKLPARCFEPPIGGPLSDKSLDFEEMERAKRHYYQLMGWDESGVPTNEKLDELGIDYRATRQ